MSERRPDDDYFGEHLAVVRSELSSTWAAQLMEGYCSATTRSSAIAELRVNLVAALAELDALEGKEPGHG